MAEAEIKTVKVKIARPMVVMSTDITYKTVHGGRSMQAMSLKMDILRQKSDKPLPAVLFVTGGGFLHAPKSSWIPQRVRIAEAGYIVASAEYTVVPNGTYRNAVTDVKAAIRYLRAHAEELNIDPERVAIMGESAGGYMAAMVGASNGTREFDIGDNLDMSSSVCAAIDIYGLSDLTKIGADYSEERQEKHRCAGVSEALYVNGIPPFGKGGSIDSNPEAVAAANPVNYISGESAPFLLLHGDSDKLVSPSQTEIMHNALKAKGVPVTRYIVSGADHADAAWYQQEIIDIIIDFLDKHLK